MAVELDRLAKEFQKSGNPDIAKGISKWAKVARERGFETLDQLEKEPKVKRFSIEQGEALEKQGFVIYELKGQSQKTLKEAGCEFWSTLNNVENHDFEELPSKRTEVAINPGSFFLPESSGKSLKEHQEMVEKYSEELGNKVAGVKAIIGDVPDYEEIAYTHLAVTKEKGKDKGEYLFGEKNNYDFARTRTKTKKIGNEVAIVGFHSVERGISIDGWPADEGRNDVHAAPLIVPA